jgi:hypothetical protein
VAVAKTACFILDLHLAEKVIAKHHDDKILSSYQEVGEGSISREKNTIKFI